MSKGFLLILWSCVPFRWNRKMLSLQFVITDQMSLLSLLNSHDRSIPLSGIPIEVEGGGNCKQPWHPDLWELWELWLWLLQAILTSWSVGTMGAVIMVLQAILTSWSVGTVGAVIMVIAGNPDILICGNYGSCNYGYCWQSWNPDLWEIWEL